MPLDAALPPSLKAILDDFRRRLNNLERSPRLTSASIRGGVLRILDPNGKAIALFGSWTDSSGKPQTVVSSIRDDGKTPGLYVGRASGGSQFTSFMDKTGRVVVSDDAIAGGLATPWVPLYAAPAGPVKENGYVYQETTDAATLTVYQFTYYQQHPRLLITGDLWAAGTTKVQLDLVDESSGTVLASDSVTGAAKTVYFTLDATAMEAATKVQTWRYLNLRLTRTGSDRTGFRVRAAYGIQS